MFKYFWIGIVAALFAIVILNKLIKKIRKRTHMKKLEAPVGVWVDRDPFMEHTISEKIVDGYLMTFEIFFKNGMKLKSRKKFTTDYEQKKFRPIDEEVSYYENGQLEYIKKFKNGVYIDPILTVHHENGSVKLTMPHESSLPHGEAKQYDQNGNLVRIDTYVYGDLTGKWITYYSDGKIEQEGNYHNGKWHGKVREYFPNRKLRIDGDFEYDKSIHEIFYHENGQVKEEWNYVDGKPNGEVITYDENGKILGRILYRDGEVVEEV